MGSEPGDRAAWPGAGEVVVVLEVEPELRGGAQRAGEGPSGAGGDRATTAEDLAQATGRDLEAACPMRCLLKS